MARLALRIAMTALAATTPAVAQQCALQSPAFCETFESGPAPLEARGRAGELDRARFSAARYLPALSTAGGIPMWIRDAEFGLIPGEGACRSGLPALLPVAQDTLVCEPTATIGTRHLVTATGAQNYGVNAYRIRQPFDFAQRTGRIAFDLDLSSWMLLGYSSVVISDDPASSPNWDLNGRGPNPRNGLILVFGDRNNYGTFASVDVREIRDYATVASHTELIDFPWVPTARGHLNHVEIRLSQQRVEIDLSPPSDDGITFPPPLETAAVTFATPLPFSRGYVALLSHNHATFKYSQGDYGTPHPLRSWNAVWDNIGFDGPRILTTREYEIAHAGERVQQTEEWHDAQGNTQVAIHPGTTTAYLIPNDPDQLSAPLTFRGVSLANATRARLVMTGYYQPWNEAWRVLPTSRLIYTINGHPRHERPFSAGELAMLENETGQGGVNHAIDLPLSQLVEGDNVFRFSTREIASGYANAVTNLDLLIDFDPQRVFGDSFE
jgi:hypothetical protein